MAISVSAHKAALEIRSRLLHFQINSGVQTSLALGAGRLVSLFFGYPILQFQNSARSQFFSLNPSHKEPVINCKFALNEPVVYRADPHQCSWAALMGASIERDFIGYGSNVPHIAWPDGATVAVNLVLVYEEGSEYSVVEGDGRNDGWGEYHTNVGPEIRDLGSETHFEYGSRAGVWRLTRLIDQYQVPVTVSATARALERNPAVAKWMRAHNHDLLGHGLRWTEMYTLSRDEERAQLREAVETYERVLGDRPLGWNSRSFPSVNTFELIQEEGGFLYHSDPCNDDLPYFQKTPSGRMLILPYSKTYNDSRFLVAPGYSNPKDFAADVCAGIDFLEEETREHGGRMMTVAVHARWTGQANRASALKDMLKHVESKPRVKFMRRLDIARHFIEHYSHLPTLPLA